MIGIFSIPPAIGGGPAPAPSVFLKYASSLSTDKLQTSAVIPLDGTIPQNNEGLEYMTLSYTPESATSMLEIEFTASSSSSISGRAIFALFQGSEVDAIAAVVSSATSSANIAPCQLRSVISSGSVTPRIYAIRIGNALNTTQIQINRRPTEDTLGASMVSILTIKEFAI